MAVGIPFPEANLILTAPTPEDAAAGTVYDLYAHRYIDIDGRPRIISKWQFQPDELAQVVANDGVFWFHAWGATHPPVAVEGANPFVRAGQGVAPAAEERPNAADWRNRAERAEAECAELREKVTGLVADDAIWHAYRRELFDEMPDEFRQEARIAALEEGKNNWDGLARSIMMAFDCDAKTPRAIFKHLSMVGQPIPQWMRDEAEMQNLDHTVSKGTRCVLIYRAMTEDIRSLAGRVG